MKKWYMIVLTIGYAAFVAGIGGTKTEALIALGLWSVVALAYVSDSPDPIVIKIPPPPKHKTDKRNKKRSRKSYPADMWG